MIPIQYRTGDATLPIAPSPWIVAHICNNMGVWGAGFVLALSKRDPRAEQLYKLWSCCELPPELAPSFGLGEIQFANFLDGYACNMIAQHGLAPKGQRAVDYHALYQCLAKLSDKARLLSATVHMPRIGCGLGGGKWSEVQPIIMRTLCAQNVPVTIYDLA